MTNAPIESPTTGPRVFYGWRVVGTVFTTQAIGAGLSTYSFGLFQVPVSEEFGVSRSTVQSAMAATMLVGAFFGPWIGRMLDRRPNRSVMLAAGLVLSLCFLSIGVAPSLPLIGLLFVLGAAVGMNGLGPLAASKLVATWFHRARGRALGISSVGTSAGGLVAPPLLALAIAAWGWRGAAVAGGIAVAAIALPLVAWTIRDRPADLGLHPDGDAEPPPAPPDGSASHWPIGELLRNRNYWIITLVIGTIFACVNGLITNLPPLAAELGAPAEQAALLISLMALFGVIGKLGFGAFADRVDKRLLMWTGMATLASFLVITLSSPSPLLLTAGCCALGVALGGALPLWGALIADCFGSQSFGEVMGWMNPCMMPLNLVGTMLLPWCYDTFGAYDPAIQGCLVALGLAAVLLAFLRVPQSADQGSEAGTMGAST